MGSSAIRLAVIGGDGIGPEVVAEALKVLKAAGVAVDAAAGVPGPPDRAAGAPGAVQRVLVGLVPVVHVIHGELLLLSG